MPLVALVASGCLWLLSRLTSEWCRTEGRSTAQQSTKELLYHAHLVASDTLERDGMERDRCKSRGSFEYAVEETSRAQQETEVSVAESKRKRPRQSSSREAAKDRAVEREAEQ